MLELKNEFNDLLFDTTIQYTKSELYHILKKYIDDDRDVINIIYQLSLPLFQFPIECASKNSQRYNSQRYDKIFMKYPVKTPLQLKFLVSAKNDAHVGLFESDKSLKRMYEIGIGCWKNTRSIIRRSAQGPNLVDVDTVGINNPHTMQPFWIDITEKNEVRVGKGHDIGQNIFMCYNDSNLYSIKYVGILCGWGSTAKWKLWLPQQGPGINQDFPIECSSGNTYKYDSIFMKYPIKTTTTALQLKFLVSAKNDAHVGLFESDKCLKRMYEFVIGGWRNTISVIRRSAQGRAYDQATTKGINNPNTMQPFWIDIQKKMKFV